MYCDFYSIVDRESDGDKFISALCNEINQSSIENYPWTFDTLFIGGGTPSLLTGHQLETILKTLSKKISITNLKEKSIEINPGEASAKSLKDFNSLGMNRISMGVQSLEPKLLNFLTRIHSVEDVFNTFENVRTAGFENVNCDLIYSIPGQTKEIWTRDLSSIIKLKPEHISAYSLTVEKGTELFQMVNSEKITMPTNDISADWFGFTRDYLSHSGFIPYEISNFSKPQKECKHNLHYWNIEPYIGFGPSAHSFDGKNRWNNVRSLDQYMKKIYEGKSPISTSEILTPVQIVNEKIGFGLRLSGGFDTQNIPEKFREKILKNVKRNQKKWNGHFENEIFKIKLNEKGFVFSDSIAVDLMIQ